MVIHLRDEVSVTDKQLCEAFFEYIIIIIYLGHLHYSTLL